MSSVVDPSAWLDTYGDMLYRFALKRVRDTAAAEDLVQDTLLAALKARENYQQRSSEKTWLVGIIKHKIIDYLRKSSRESPLDEDENVAADLVDRYFNESGHWQAQIGSWVKPDKSLENEQFWQAFSDCVDALPERQAQVFMLTELDGLSADEICKVMEVSTTNNVWVMLSRIRMRLRQCLENRWFESQVEG